MLPEVRAAFAARGITDIRTPDKQTGETELATSAIADGATTIVCVGGDGTCGNVANAILHSNTSVRFGVIPGGTGNDFAKTLGVTSTPFDEIARLALEPSNRTLQGTMTSPLGTIRFS